MTNSNSGIGSSAALGLYSDSVSGTRLNLASCLSSDSNIGTGSNNVSGTSSESVNCTRSNDVSSSSLGSVFGLTFELSSSSRIDFDIDSNSSFRCTSSPAQGSESGFRSEFCSGQLALTYARV